MHTPEPVVLTGRIIRLQPMSPDDVPRLWAAGNDPALWKYATVRMESEADMSSYVSEALRDRDRGIALPFVIVEEQSRRVAGSTRYGNIAPAHRRLEIGWTWLGREWQRTGVNSECKYLLLRHAFESLGADRVEFKTDALNTISRRAILRLGAREEGTLRRHMVTATGRVRDTVYYSIIAGEWADVKKSLQSPAGGSVTPA